MSQSHVHQAGNDRTYVDKSNLTIVWGMTDQLLCCFLDPPTLVAVMSSVYPQPLLTLLPQYHHMTLLEITSLVSLTSS